MYNDGSSPQVQPRDRQLADRRSGELLRAMAKLFLKLSPRQSRESLAGKLQRRLLANGVRYHCRTIKRQLAGEVASVPRVVEDAMRDLLASTHNLKDAHGVEAALENAGISVSRAARMPCHVDVRRLVRPTRLWLHFHPSSSKRALALVLTQRLARRDVRVSADGLQAALAGKGTHVRSEVLKQLVAMLSDHGIVSEADALRHYESLCLQVESTLKGRELVGAGHFLKLVDVWWSSQGGASKRALARKLRAALAAQAIELSLEHLQALVHGKKRLVQQRVVDSLERLVQEGLPPGGTIERAIADVAQAANVIEDLEWVQAEPVVRLARRWLDEHPDVSQRRLALLLATTTRQMGYRTSHHTIQPILSGGRKKTRGYIHRAMMRQFAAAEMRHES